MLNKTSRDRPKSAPCPRLKNSKRTSKSQFTVLENRKGKKMERVARRGPLARAPGAPKGDTSEIVNIFVAVEGGPLEKKQIFEKRYHNAEKLKGGTLWGLSTFILSQNIKKLKGEIFYFRKKNLSAGSKTERGDHLGFSNIHSDAKRQKN